MVSELYKKIALMGEWQFLSRLKSQVSLSQYYESFVSSAVLNHSYTDEAAVQYISVSVAYDADVPKALKILLEEGSRPRARIATNHKGWSCIDSLGDSGINLQLAFWVKDPEEWDSRH